MPALLPLIACALLLSLLVARRGRPALALTCLSLALWALSVLLGQHPQTQAIGGRVAMIGFLLPAAFLHAALEAIGERGRVRLAYGIAAAFFVVGAVWPDLFLQNGGRQPGPAFPVMFGAAGLLSAWPLWLLSRRLPGAAPGERERILYLLFAAFLSTAGGGLNLLSLLAGHPTPAGLYMALGSLVLLAWVVQSTRLPTFGQFVEASLRYSVGAALLSTAYLFAVLVFLRPEQARTDPGWSWDSWSGGLLLFELVLLGQPLLAGARSWLAGRVLPERGDVAELTRALAESEARAEHASRLAELGTLGAAVAHEIRNPLGVIVGAVGVLERQGAGGPALDEIRGQVARAARFADELLELGRPSALHTREVDLRDVAALGVGPVERALDMPGRVEIIGGPALATVDPAQLSRAVGILVENALLAAESARVRVTVSPRSIAVEDDGPGVPQALEDRLFEPFVSGRGRHRVRTGTGLGLAIARGIVARHGGDLVYVGRSAERGGAHFEARLPTRKV